MARAFQNWMNRPQQVTAAPAKTPKPKKPKVVVRGGGNRPKNKNPYDASGGGAAAAAPPESPRRAPSLPTLDAGLGLNAPGVGAITDSIYSQGFFDPKGTNPYTPVAAAAAAGVPSPGPVTINPNAGMGVQINPMAGTTGDDGGFRAWVQGQGINFNGLNPNRRARLREQYQAQLAPAPGPAAGSTGAGLSDTNDWENSQSDADPAGTVRSMFNEAGLQFGNDAQGQFYASQIAPLVAAYESMIRDEANSGMTIMDFIGNLGPVNYGQAGWGDSFNQFWRGRYNTAPQSIRDPYSEPTRTQGPSRWLAFGN